MCKTWPFMDDLLKNISLVELPTDLKAQLYKRYDEHASEYALEKQWDGIPINACMEADTIRDIQEEIVDSCFNTLVLLLKLQKRAASFSSGDGGRQFAWNLWANLMDIWNHLEHIRRVEVS